MNEIKDKKGFTLVELLTAIVILGILTGMAFPVISNLKSVYEKKKYETYAKSVEYSSKLYVDSYNEDLFGHNEVGCKYVRLSTLIEKKLAKDIDVDEVSCNTDTTFVEVRKYKNNYKYRTSLGCGKVDKETNNVFVDYQIPEGGFEKIAYCENGSSIGSSIDVSLSPNASLDNDNKSVDIEIVVTSYTGIKDNISISYGFVKKEDMNDYSKVAEWKEAEFTVDSEDDQLEYLLDEETTDPITLVSTAVTTPTAETGEYQLVLRVNKLNDIYDNPWRDNSLKYIYSDLYKVDNSPPNINSFDLTSKIVESGNTSYAIEIDGDDIHDGVEQYSSSDELMVCFKKDGFCANNVNKETMKREGYIPINKFNEEHFDESRIGTIDAAGFYTVNITLADAAGNTQQKTDKFSPGEKYQLNYNMNGCGGSCSPTSKLLYTTPEQIATEKVEWGDLCNPTLSGKIFKGWNTKNDGTGADINETTKLTSSTAKTTTVYAKCEDEGNIHYTLCEGVDTTASTLPSNCTTGKNKNISVAIKTGYYYSGATTDRVNPISTTSKIVKYTNTNKKQLQIVKCDGKPYSFNFKCVLNNFTIEYYCSNGTNTLLSTQTGNYGDTVKISELPTDSKCKKTCYHPSTWQSNKATGNVEWTPGTEKKWTYVKTIDGVVANAKNDTVLKLYTKFEGDNYTVSLNCNEGTGDTQTKTCTYGSNCILPENICKHSNSKMNFIGWSKTTTGDAAYADKANVKDIGCTDVTLYAVWKEKIDIQARTTCGTLDKSVKSIVPGNNVTFTLTTKNGDKCAIGRPEDISVTGCGSSYSFSGLSRTNNTGNMSIKITFKNLTTPKTCSITPRNKTCYELQKAYDGSGRYYIYYSDSFVDYYQAGDKSCICCVRAEWNKEGDGNLDHNGFVCSGTGRVLYKKFSFDTNIHSNEKYWHKNACSTPQLRPYSR